jgi:hypothetical protein
MYDLKMRGINAWVDKSGLVAGEQWMDSIPVGLGGTQYEVRHIKRQAAHR